MSQGPTSRPPLGAPPQRPGLGAPPQRPPDARPSSPLGVEERTSAPPERPSRERVAIVPEERVSVERVSVERIPAAPPQRISRQSIPMVSEERVSVERVSVERVSRPSRTGDDDLTFDAVPPPRISQERVPQERMSPAPAAPAAPAPAAAPRIVAGTGRIDRFLKLMNDRGASDLHLSVGRPPIFRLSGRMEPIRYRTLSDEDFRELVQPIAPPHLWADFVALGDADFAYEVPGLSRFRVNLFRQQRGMGAVFRIIPTKLMTVEQLGLPDCIRRVVAMRSGLVLVTGPTGSGKSTTLSAIINEMNETRRMHFVTIEDPIEFVHPNKKSLMSQREVGPHSKSFSTALRASVREDPDAVLVGEMRDLETISMALSAAETGVLVFGTLHTNSAAKTIDRIINVFPAEKQPGVRGTLASVMKCIVAQQLLRKKGGGRVAAVEVLFGSPAMSSMVRDGKTHQINGLIKLGKKDGMIAMDDALRALVESDTIDPLAGLEKSLDKDDFRKWLKDRGEEVPEGEHA